MKEVYSDTNFIAVRKGTRVRQDGRALMHQDLMKSILRSLGVGMENLSPIVMAAQELA